MSIPVMISTQDAPSAIGPYSQAVIANGFVFVSGQTPLDPATQQLVEGGLEAQAEQALRNVEAILKAAGSGLEQVVRCVVYLSSMEHFAAMNRVYERFFEGQKPSRSTVAVAGLPRGALIEIEATALLALKGEAA